MPTIQVIACSCPAKTGLCTTYLNEAAPPMCMMRLERTRGLGKAARARLWRLDKTDLQRGDLSVFTIWIWGN